MAAEVDVKSGSWIRWILLRLGFQLDFEAETATKNYHSSFKDPDLTKKIRIYPDPNPDP
jgi:hypothetical protein